MSNENLNLYEFDDVVCDGLVSYTLNNYSNSNDTYKKIFVAYNSNLDNKTITLPQGEWQVLVNEKSSDLYLKDIYVAEEVTVAKQSAIILGMK